MVKEKIRKIFRITENSAMMIALFFIVALPFSDLVLRKINGTGNPKALIYLCNLMIWMTMAGAMISSREKKHISLALVDDHLPVKLKKWVQFFVATVTSTVLMSFTYASIDQCVYASIGVDVSGIPQLVFTIALPIGFFVMAMRAARQENTILRAVTTGIAVILPIVLMGVPTALIGQVFPNFTPSIPVFSALYIPFVVLLLIAAFLGAPIFTVLGGIAAVLFFNSDQTIGNIPDEAFQVLTNDVFPTIPLFTIAGFLLSESKSGERLVAFFKAIFGGIPGGTAIMSVVVCAFFTTFTGASGVTILALGGLLFYILSKEGYSEKFSIGHLAASGSVGLLLPPSLPVILYGVQAQISVKEMFAGGVLPGILMISILVVYAIIKSPKIPRENRTPFSWSELGISLKSAIFELILPVLIVVLFFTGQATLLETGVVAVVYLLVVNMVIHRDITLKSLPNVLLKAAPIAGSVLIILAAAKGLSQYIVIQEIPMKLTEAVKTVLDPSDPSSKLIFLLILNVALLIVGCFMDIFSAIIVVVPLILPISAAFGINPVHLGIIFLANLELGYLTPPVGLNLFLAALRFEKPLVQIYISAIPFIFQKLVIVLLITYIPAITLSGVELLSYLEKILPK